MNKVFPFEAWSIGTTPQLEIIYYEATNVIDERVNLYDSLFTRTLGVPQGRWYFLPMSDILETITGD